MTKRKFLHIGLNFADQRPRVEIIQPIFDRTADDWLRYAPNCWIAWTARPASDWFYFLKPVLGPNDTMLIAKMEMSERNGWLPKWAWDWIDKKRELSPLPPPARPPNDLAKLMREMGLGSSAPFGLAPPKPFSDWWKQLPPPNPPRKKP